MYCTNCGSKLEDNQKFCTNCGAPVSAPEQPVYQEPVNQQESGYQTYQQPTYQQQSYEPRSYEYQPPASYPSYTPPQVPNRSIGGLVVFAIITTIICPIAGLVALSKVFSINHASSVEEQEQRAGSVKKWCIGGLIVGIGLNVLMMASAL